MATDLLDLTLSKREEILVRNRAHPVIEKYGSQTKFSRQELDALMIIHYKLTKKRPMDRKYFSKVMFKLFDFYSDTLMDSIFSAFDRFNKLVITTDSWILGMSIFLRGDLEEKIKFCFTVYDLMGHGVLKKDRLIQLMKNSIRTTPDEDTKEVVRDMVEFILKKMDRDRDGELSFEDYRTSVKQNPDLLEAFGYCFPPRPAVYTFLTTFTKRVTTMHYRYIKPPSLEKQLKTTSVLTMFTTSTISSVSRNKPTN